MKSHRLRIAFCLSMVGAAAATASACGSDESAAAGGTAGASATGGKGGSGGKSGSGGGGGTSGSGGTSTGGKGGSGGSGGTAGADASSGGTGGVSGDAGIAGSAGADAAMCTSTCDTAGCGTCPTNSTVAIHNAYQNKDYTVDATEVTNAEYSAFLAARVDPTTQSAECAWNTSFVPPANWPPTGKLSYPVTNVDWCDADAYCKWSKRRLCGNIGGGPVVSVYFTNGDQSQWFEACTGHKTGSLASGWQSYPYSDTYNPTACNGADYADAGATIAVGSDTTCVGGFAGLFDMSGNVNEWIDSCDAAADAGTGETDQCRTAGGSFGSAQAQLKCDSVILNARNHSSGFLGFRCCS